MKSLPRPLYRTRYGAAYLGDALDLLACLADDSTDLVMTSPPFALQRQKEYGNVDQDEYVDWLLLYTAEVRRVLKESGSFVLDLGGAYRRGRPVRSLYNYRILIRLWWFSIFVLAVTSAFYELAVSFEDVINRRLSA